MSNQEAPQGLGVYAGVKDALKPLTYILSLCMIFSPAVVSKAMSGTLDQMTAWDGGHGGGHHGSH